MLNEFPDYAQEAKRGAKQCWGLVFNLLKAGGRSLLSVHFTFDHVKKLQFESNVLPQTNHSKVLRIFKRLLQASRDQWDRVVSAQQRTRRGNTFVAAPQVALLEAHILTAGSVWL